MAYMYIKRKLNRRWRKGMFSLPWGTIHSGHHRALNMYKNWCWFKRMYAWPTIHHCKKLAHFEHLL